MKKAFRTITELESELKGIRQKVQKGKLWNGDFGINACMESIKFNCYISSEKLEEYYSELVMKGLTDRTFNTKMIVACEILMERNAD